MGNRPDLSCVSRLPRPACPTCPIPPCLPHPPSSTLRAVPKLSVTVITKNEAADIGAALASVAWADEIVVVDSQSTDETVGDRAAARRPRRRARLDRLRRAEEPRGVDCEPRLDSVARRRRARDAGAGGRDPGACSPGRPHRRSRFACRGSPGISADGSGRPTGIPTTSCGSTIGASAQWTGRYVHEAVTVRGATGRSARRAAALRLPRHRRSSRDDRPLHDLRRASDARGRPPRRRCCRSPATRRSPSCATTSRAAASATACPASSSRR